MSLIKKDVAIPIIISVVLSVVIGFGVGYQFFHPPLQTLEAQLETYQQAYITASLIDSRLTSGYSHTIQGTLINFGTETASNIVITVKWYIDGASFHQETITVPSLEGRAVKEINFTYSFQGAADEFDYTLTWD